MFVKKRPSQVYSGDTRGDDEEEEFRVNVNATVSFLHMHVYFHFEYHMVRNASFLLR